MAMQRIAHVHVQAPPSDRTGATREAVENALYLLGYLVDEVTGDLGPLDLSLPDDLPASVVEAVWAAARSA